MFGRCAFSDPLLLDTIVIWLVGQKCFVCLFRFRHASPQASQELSGVILCEPFFYSSLRVLEVAVVPTMPVNIGTEVCIGMRQLMGKYIYR